MNVAFCTRPDFLAVRGGDTVQLLQTRELLQENHGARVDIITDPAQLRAEQYDICHLFNIQRMDEIRRYLAKCHRAGVKTALSTVLWDYSAVVAYNFMVNRMALPKLTPWRLQATTRGLRLLAPLLGLPTIFTAAYRQYLRETLTAADLLLPNSREEGEQLVRLSGLAHQQVQGKVWPVVNAVAVSEPDPAAAARLAERYRLPAGYLLQVGRIEPGKNQYGTIRALMDRPELPLVFVGNQRVNLRYARLAMELGEQRGNVWFIEELPHEELPLLYRQAALHLLPSLGETTGLVSLEALACGCRAVVADARFCPYDSYFRGVATAVDPLDVGSIRAGVLAELAQSRDMEAVSRRVRLEFSWETAARQTQAAYERLLSGALSPAG